jgi:hypothetical protein
MASTKTVYKTSPFGEAIHPWINKADTKFNEAGLFKVDHLVTGAEAQAQKAEIDKAAEAAFEEMTAEMTAGERKKFTIYRPYEVQEDDDGNPTGAIVFNYKQNATIRLKDGTTKNIKISIQDAKGNDTSVAIYGGSIIRVMYSMRPIKMAGTKQIGVRLDFSMVQVKKLGKGSGGKGFGAIEDIEDDDFVSTPGDNAPASNGSVDGDY